MNPPSHIADPDVRILAPIRERALSRDASVEYARQHSIEVEEKGRNPFSIDANLWGRSIECGVLEDPWQEPPEEAFFMTSPAAGAAITWRREASLVLRCSWVISDRRELVTFNWSLACWRYSLSKALMRRSLSIRRCSARANSLLRSSSLTP